MSWNVLNWGRILLISMHAMSLAIELTGKITMRRLSRGIREHSDIVISVTCSGRNYSELEKRAEVLNLSSNSSQKWPALL